MSAPEQRQPGQIQAAMYLFPADCRSVADELHFDCPITSREQIASEATRAFRERRYRPGICEVLGWGPLYTREQSFVHDIAADRQMLVFDWRLTLRAVWIGGGGGEVVNCACGEGGRIFWRVIFFNRRA
jgi:hypothetical protein